MGNALYEIDILRHEDVAEKTVADMSIGQLIEAMAKIKSLRAEMNEKVKDLNAAFRIYEGHFMNLLDESDSDMARAHGMVASITKTEVPNLDDFDEFCEYVRREDAWYLINKSVKSAPWRELLHQGVIVPGTSVYEKRSVSLTKNKS